jgi:hypothetical protein
MIKHTVLVCLAREAHPTRQTSKGYVGIKRAFEYRHLCVVFVPLQ